MKKAISRRDFLKVVGVSAAALGMTHAAVLPLPPLRQLLPPLLLLLQLLQRAQVRAAPATTSP